MRVGSSSRSRNRSRRVQWAETGCALDDALRIPLLHFARRGVHARLLRAADPHQALEDVAHRRAQDDVPVARCERDQQSARYRHTARVVRTVLAGGGCGFGRRVMGVAEEEYERRVGQGGEPGEEGQAVEPGPDRVCALWDWTAEVRD